MRWACGACVVHQTVSLPLTASWSAIAPQVSIGAGCERGNTMSCSTTTSARANAASVAAASPDSQSKTWLPSAAGVVVADHRRVGLERAARVDHRLERLVLDVDQLERVAGRVVVVGDDERDLLALEAHLVGREHRLRGRPTSSASTPSRAPRGRAPVMTAWTRGQRQRRRGVDRDDPGVGERAAQDRAVEHPGQRDVVEVAALAADEPRVLLAPQPAEADRACVRGGHARCARSSSSSSGAGRRPATRR